MAIPYFSPFLPLLSNPNDYLSWMEVMQGWSRCLLIMGKGWYYGPNDQVRSVTVVTLEFYDCEVSSYAYDLSRFFPPPYFIMPFLEQTQPQVCSPHSRESSCESASSVCALVWALTEFVLQQNILTIPTTLLFQEGFDHCGTALPPLVCVLHCSALISAGAWRFWVWQVVRDSRAIPTLATKWSPSWSLSF